MKSAYGDLTDRYLVLLRIDSLNLFNRIQIRQDDYIEAFSLKRNRSVFKEVFDNRYQKANLNDLSNLPIEVIEVANNFYTDVDELYWYLKHTQDMPNTIQDSIIRKVAQIAKKHEMLCLYIDALLSGKDLAEILNAQTAENDDFMTHGELEAEAEVSDYIQEEVYTDAD